MPEAVGMVNCFIGCNLESLNMETIVCYVNTAKDAHQSHLLCASIIPPVSAQVWEQRHQPSAYIPGANWATSKPPNT